ncbi:MAG: deoxynucleoside kinase [Saprospiraceae bacterium]|nr:deoxynucleoside kinase [Saprospiraceae bacterium]
MKNKDFPYSYIAIEGNIGAGKTTLCQMMAEQYACKLILEQFTDNPFLPFFYQNPERYAFPVELFFMTERHKQLQQNLPQQSLFETLTVSDYFFVKTLLFAQNNLSNEEFRLFQRLFNILNATFTHPDLLVYLHRSVDDLLFNIKQRGRAFEQQISKSYLEQIQGVYFSYLKSITDIPVLILYMDGIRFWENPDQFQTIVQALQQPYLPRIYHLNLF